MPRLRDGTTSEDPRLDRLLEFDARSRNFPVRRLVAEKPTRSYTWRVGWPPGSEVRLDQGAEGSCVGHAWGHELLARPLLVRGIDHRYARETIYWEAQKLDPWPGGSYPGAAPRYEGTSTLAGAKVCQRLGHFDEYRWAFSLEDFVLGVGYTGPAVLGCWWWSGMMQIDAKGFIHPTGRRLGGHAILAYGVRIVKRDASRADRTWSRNIDLGASYMKLWNSWGADWGIRGTCSVSLADLETLFLDQGEACFPVRRRKVKQ